MITRGGLWALTVTVFFLFTSLPSFGSGSATSGGGSTEKSTDDQVIASAKQAADDLIYLLKSCKTPHRNDCVFTSMDSMTQGIVDGTGKKINLHRLMDGTQYVFKDECADEEAAHSSGSAIIGDAQTPFCLNMKELKLIPPDELYQQLFPLMAHELSHQAGYHEQDAVYLQNYLLAHIKGQDSREIARGLLSTSQSALKEDLDLLKNKAPKQRICAALGQTEGLLTAVRYTDVDYPEPAQNATFPIDVAPDLLAYCGFKRQYFVPTWMNVPTPCEGDTQSLQSALEGLLNQVNTVLNKIPE